MTSRIASLILGSLVLPLGCQTDPIDPAPLGGTENSGPTLPTAGESTVGADSTGTGDSGSSSGDDTTGGPPTSCADVVCEGNGGCLIDDGIAGCYCDQGYVLDESGTTCVVDTTCIELHFLEDRCRLIVNGPPAVTLFFAVDYCAGTAVLPADLAAQELSFRVLENGVDISNNVESYSTVIPKEVESYVTIVLDVSDSVTGTEDAPNPELPQLVGELRSFVQQLAPGPGEPDVYVSMYVFGRFVREYVPFTRDYASLDAAIAAIEDDPIAINTLVNGDGTRLYDSVETGINRTQRIRDLRDAVTHGGVLSTGTVVVITDGLESTNGTLNTSLIANTLNQVISIGISPEVTANDEDLTAIGRDGSFLAPEPENWGEAFSAVVSRVREYPQRAYLLGYCTSAAQDVAEVEITLGGRVIPVETATCNFDASSFSINPADTCSPAFFETECNSQSCGGLTACGACADDQCCDGQYCEAPASASDCDGADQLCSATNQICVEGMAAADPHTCQDPDGIGGGPCDPGCEPGVGYCQLDGMDMPIACVPTLPVDPNGANCEEAAECESLNCRSANPDNEFLLPTCLPPALIYDDCGAPGSTVCEDGSWCSGGSCRPQLFPLSSCSAADQCRSGLCAAPVSSNLCIDSGVCFWAWDEKVPS